MGRIQKVLDLLSQSTFIQGIVAGVPEGVKVAHKFGEAEGVDKEGKVVTHILNDCGIVYKPESPYILCIMIEGEDYSQMEKVFKITNRLCLLIGKDAIGFGIISITDTSDNVRRTLITLICFTIAFTNAKRAGKLLKAEIYNNKLVEIDGIKMIYDVAFDKTQIKTLYIRGIEGEYEKRSKFQVLDGGYLVYNDSQAKWIYYSDDEDQKFFDFH